MNISFKYNPKSVEKKIYHEWMKENCFSSFPDNKRIPYSIIMPPPNITGILHIGHMLNNTLQDVLIRYARMNGYNSCWIPSTDHASIATEARVSYELKKKGLSKFLLGRKRFLSHVLRWANKHQEIIFDQIRQIGCSCDWNRVQFTMDKNLYDSVKKCFIDLYDQGFIYRGYHVVNWDTQAKTTISDEEVIYKEQMDKLYYLTYKIKNENYHVTIATTRPETIFGDTAICYHPCDKRFFHLKGKKAIVPIINREIPIIQDSCVDRQYGTGCFKVTPAHDRKDQILYKKYKLNIINLFHEDGTMNENALHYQGLDRFEVRKKIVQELNILGFLKKIEPCIHKIGFSERTSTIVEYRLSLQWFLKMKKISIPAIEAVKNGDIQFYPEKMKKNYIEWMENIHDWNISRQLWWGHRIPVFYYGKKMNEFVVADSWENALKKARKKTNNPMLKDLFQENDVLDTWFSSWILPITLFDGINHPENKEICYYYPTEIIVTGYDILFFWIARMIISGYFFMKKKPFSKVFFTGIMRDSNDKKISKSLNNSPNTIKLIDQYGADSLRFGLMLKNSAGKDFHFDEKICLQGKNFSNKIWNAFRLIKSWTFDEKEEEDGSECNKIACKWLKNRFYFILEKFEKFFVKYKLEESLMIIYKFVCFDFCSWYLEIIKPIKNKKKISKKTYKNTILYFEYILQLLHPYMPFISEKIWHLLKEKKRKKFLISSHWPKRKSYDNNIINSFEKTMQIISKIRNIRKENNLPFKERLVLFFMRKIKKNEYDSIILKLANISNIISVDKEPKGSSFFSFILNSEKFFLFHENKKFSNNHNTIINIEKKIKYFYGLLSIIQKNLSNNEYIRSVPEYIFLKEKKKERDTLKKIIQLKEHLKYLLNNENIS
ncbi:valine--tRNA ligase [Blattabacterium cuenoti]|uniref:valine--tRNA ligase n=1 Tax=Blattabacterium cuenoti TaxID=1653831 RepID=UPI00163C485F|nr:valine--tRNA ligase [Blattabacterium cuenoti]